MNIDGQLAVSSVTFRDEPLERALEWLAAGEFTQLDLTAIRRYCDHFDPLLVDVDDFELVRVRDAIARAGFSTVSVTGFPANPLAKDLNGDDWADGVDAYVELARYLQAPYLILPPGSPAPPDDRWRGTVQDVLPWQQEAIRRAHNAHLHPSFALQSNSLLRTAKNGTDFLQILHTADIGLAVDPAHLAAMGENPARAIRAMGTAVNFVMLRDMRDDNFNLPPGSGTLDYAAILAALNEINYTGPLVLAVDDVTLPLAQRLDLLLQGRDFLHGWGEQRAAA